MIIEIVKHFQPEDEDFYGDFYTTVEVEGEVLVTYMGSNTDDAEAFADGYAMGRQTNSIIKTVCRADAEFETD